ncbi:ABC transporter substrate-binding protein [Saccharomonospora saliphila]|uniref:ABC transporter substrate-binding protein n=1 Tax=Saccharomonospora saliphila TaxID=369829 RepID=UPI0003737E04|nr:ABC transporter substrate-binding protein [Saccharomonospora saliphila]
MAAALLLGVGLSACGTDGGNAGSSSGDGTVDVGYVQLPIFAPLFVAQDKGYFADEGIQVNLEKVKSGQDAIPLASSGKLDAVLAGFSAGMFSAINSGLDVKVVGSMGVADGDTERPPSALVVRQELIDSGEVSSLADLKGRKIGALGGESATSAFYVGMALEEAGLSVTDVEFVPMSNPDIPTGLRTGGIDAGFVSAPFWEMAVSDGVAEKIWTTPEGTSGTGTLYGGEFAASEDAQKFHNALARAAQDLQGEQRYSEENLRIIAEATDQSVEDVKSVPLYAWLPDLAPLPDQLAAMEQSWMEIGALQYDEPIPQEEYVDTSFADNVAASEPQQSGATDE